MTTNGAAVSAWAIEGPAANSTPSMGASWWHSFVAGKQQAADGSLVGLSGTAIPIATYPEGIDLSVFNTITFGYASGGGGVTTVQSLNTPYQDWGDTHELIGPDRDPTASPAMDGVPNIVKYGLGLDPTVQSNSSPSVSILDISGSDYFAIQFTRPSGQSDLTTVGQISSDLNSWSSEPGDVVTVITDNGDGTETVTIRPTIPMDVLPQAYLRALFSF